MMEKMEGMWNNAVNRAQLAAKISPGTVGFIAPSQRANSSEEPPEYLRFILPSVSR